MKKEGWQIGPTYYGRYKDGKFYFSKKPFKIKKDESDESLKIIEVKDKTITFSSKIK